MLDPSGRVILVSGANRGIGRAIAEALHDRGYSLSLGARDPRRVGLEGPRVACFRFDALDRSSHAAWIEGTLARFGRIDGLINNAGTGSSLKIMDDDEAGLDHAWAVNVKAPLNVTRLALPHLKASGAGRIVNVASLSGKRVRNDNIVYAMTKFAVVALSHGTRRLGWEDGVRATALCPGFVKTEATAAVTKVPRERMIDPADLAELVATVIALPNSASVAELQVNCQLEDAF